MDVVIPGLTFAALFQTPQIEPGQSWQWQGREVLNEGDELEAVTNGGEWSLVSTGYEFLS